MIGERGGRRDRGREGGDVIGGDVIGERGGRRDRGREGGDVIGGERGET